MHVSYSSVNDYDDYIHIFFKHQIIVIILNVAHHYDDHGDDDTDNDGHLRNSIICT